VGASGPAKPPNIVVIRTDDQTLSAFRHAFMPKTTRFLVDRGTTFTNFELSSPQCCPSRAAYLTGQYGHNNGVLSNSDAYGSLISPANVLPVWLQRAGYFTAHLGKWMNGYGQEVGDWRAVAPGWDQWFTAKSLRYYNYNLSVNGRTLHEGARPRDYITRVLNRRALSLIRRHANASKPMYLQFDERAPHDQAHGQGPPYCHRGVAVPAPGDIHRYRDLPLPRGPSFNEADVSDKPSFVRDQPRLGHDDVKEIKREYRCAAGSLREVDRGVARMVRATQREGAMDHTVFAFTSDNGLYFGEHRQLSGKVLPYEEAVHVPLVMRVPPAYRDGAARVAQVSELTSNIDLAPTILDLAGGSPCDAKACRVMDGRSLLGLLRGDASGYPNDRGLASEYSGQEIKGVCDYRAIHARGQVYVDYRSVVSPATGECTASQQRELYDLEADPFELDNLYPASPQTGEFAIEQDLRARLAALEGCAGIAGRDAPQPGHPFCE
jgi:N-acetylglucosamine-6-sulfatase